MGPGPGRDGRDRQAGGPRARVPHPAEAHCDRPEQFQGSGGREHGPLELHIAPSPGRAVRTPELLSDVPRQERRVRGRRVSAERCPGAAATQKVRTRKVLRRRTFVRTECRRVFFFCFLGFFSVLYGFFGTEKQSPPRHSFTFPHHRRIDKSLRVVIVTVSCLPLAICFSERQR